MLLARLFVEICPGCGARSAAGFCRTCAAGFERVGPTCPRCGLAQPVTSCPKADGAWHLEFVAAPFAYVPPLDRFVLALKYRRARNLGRALGLLLAAELDHASPRPDALIPIPLHPSRLRERGYNQATEIAWALSRSLDVPLLLSGVRRTKPTAPQTGGTAALRRRNVAEAFAVSTGVAGLQLAIVDDVVTTGATINALAQALEAAGAARVGAWAVARTRPPDAARSTAAQARNT